MIHIINGRISWRKWLVSLVPVTAILIQSVFDVKRLTERSNKTDIIRKLEWDIQYIGHELTNFEIKECFFLSNRSIVVLPLLVPFARSFS